MKITTMMKRAWRKATAFAVALAASAMLQSEAREISAISIDGSNATLTMTAGESGDNHCVYWAWSTDGLDHGETIGDWPHVVRLGYVAYNATSKTFALPPPAQHQYPCRAFLMSSRMPYDYLISSVSSTGSQYVDTALAGSDRAYEADFTLDAVPASDGAIFGARSTTYGKFKLALWLGNSAWSWVCCTEDTAKWNRFKDAGNNDIAPRVGQRIQAILDAGHKTYSFSTNGVLYSSGTMPDTVDSGKWSSNNNVMLFAESNSGTIDRYTSLTLYSHKVYDKDGSLLHDFRPAVSNGVAGLANIVYAGGGTGHQYDRFFSSGSATPLVASGTNVSYYVASGDVQAAVSPMYGRLITDVSLCGGNATLTMMAGKSGDNHCVYWAWSDDGLDYGGTIGDWPHVVRLGYVADDATSATFVLPPPARSKYPCRAFLMSSRMPYDYLISSVKSTGSQHVDTGNPGGSERAYEVDFTLDAVPSIDGSIFGARSTKSSGGKFKLNLWLGSYWLWVCNTGNPAVWNRFKDAGNNDIPTQVGQRIHAKLDAKNKTYQLSIDGVLCSSGSMGTTIEAGKWTSDNNIMLFAESNSGEIDRHTSLTLYSYKIYNESGSKIHDYRPAVYNGVAGLANIVYAGGGDASYDKFFSSGSSTPLVASGTNITYYVVSGDVQAAVSQSVKAKGLIITIF